MINQNNGCFASRRNQPNLQEELFACLNHKQQKTMAAILRVLKPWAQTILCRMLLDYMETGEIGMTRSFVVDSLAIYLVSTSVEGAVVIPKFGHGSIGL